MQQFEEKERDYKRRQKEGLKAFGKSVRSQTDAQLNQMFKDIWDFLRDLNEIPMTGGKHRQRERLTGQVEKLFYPDKDAG